MTTTIKVGDELRDRLKAQAAVSGLTLGAHLANLADAEDRRRRFASMRVAIAATSAEDMASYRRETEDWDRASAADWPE